jgi:ATP citrate (pro-S)-lyase
MPRADHVFSF